MEKELSPVEHQQNRLLRNILFTFFVSGAASQPLGSFIPFLREQYGFRYNLSGVLLSCQSTGNLISALLAGFLPIYLGRRRAILVTSVWMAAAYLIFAGGFASPALLVVAFTMTGIARGGNSNFSNTMISTLPGDKATRGYNLLHGCFAVGALLSPLVLVFCTDRWPNMGWRLVALLLALLWLVIFCGRMIGAAVTGKVSRNRLLLMDGAGFFAFFLLMFFSRTPGLVVMGLMGVGLFMATIYPTAFAFGSDCIRGNDLGCSIMIFTGSAGGILTPFLVGQVAEWVGIRAGIGVVAVCTALLLVSIALSVLSVRSKRSGIEWKN